MENLFDGQFWFNTMLNIKTWAVEELPGVFGLIVLFIVAFRLIKFSFKRLTKTLINRAEKSSKTDTNEATKRINTLVGISSGVIRIVVWVVFLMMLLQKFGANIGPLLASVGIIGLAVGFGAQELVRDFISGFFMMLENQVRTGDVAVINGTGGLVEKVELRTITLRDFSGTIHIFQNGKISSMSNMTKEWSASVFDIGVAYKEDVTQVMDIMRKVGDEMQNDPEFQDKILEPIEVLGVDAFADSAVVIKARMKTKPIMQWTISREYRKRLKYAFDSQNIEIPFPHTTLYWGEKIDSLKLEMKDK